MAKENPKRSSSGPGEPAEEHEAPSAEGALKEAQEAVSRAVQQTHDAVTQSLAQTEEVLSQSLRETQEAERKAQQNATTLVHTGEQTIESARAVLRPEKTGVAVGTDYGERAVQAANECVAAAARAVQAATGRAAQGGTPGLQASGV